MPKNNGNIDIGGISVDFVWRHDRLTLSARTGQTIAFLIQAQELAQRYPHKLAQEVVESGITKGVISSDLDLFVDMSFEVQGPISLLSTSKVIAIPMVP